MGNHILYSFIILTYNSERYIEQCLQSINESISELRANTEVFVVDNGSKDGTLDILKSFTFNEFVNYKTIVFEQNTGTTYSRNAALKKSTGENIVILDSDAYVNSEVLDNLQKYLSQHIECGLVVPKLIYPDGRYQMSVDRFPTLLHKINRFFFLKKIEGRNQITEIRDVNYAISAFWMFPRATLNEVGLLDEKIFYSPEDVDYCIRIWKSGKKIVYIPDYFAVHDAQEISRSKGFKLINIFSLSHIKGLIYLYIKHAFIFSGDKFIR